MTPALLKAFPWRAPAPDWEPGAWMVGNGVGVWRDGAAWHVVRFTAKRIQVWDYGRGDDALVNAVADARRCGLGKRPVVEADWEVSL